MEQTSHSRWNRTTQPQSTVLPATWMNLFFLPMNVSGLKITKHVRKAKRKREKVKASKQKKRNDPCSRGHKRVLQWVSSKNYGRTFIPKIAIENRSKLETRNLKYDCQIKTIKINKWKRNKQMSGHRSQPI